MLQISCDATLACPSMYQCDVSTMKCIHQDIFPLTLYTIIVYIFTTLACGLCNISGNSMGIFKILILMVLLSYNLDEATGLAQALVVGSALPNFITLLAKKHPYLPSSLINYNLVYIIIPCSLLGSTVGSLAQTFIPKIGQIGLIVLVFSFFIYSFQKKVRKIWKQNTQKTQNSLLQTTMHEIQHESKMQLEMSSEKMAIMRYERSIHLKDILTSLVMFVCFELVSFAVQGKLPWIDVNRCSLMFILGILGLLAATLVYLFLIRIHINHKFTIYKEYSIIQEIKLDNLNIFSAIVAGGFAAGFIQGVLGMGCGTCIMMVLLTFPIHPTAASATSSYQILFTGLGSLFEYYINGQVKMFETIWFIGICAIGGGIVTLILYVMVRKLKQRIVSLVLYTIIIMLCLMSIAMTVPTVLRILDQDGWEGLTSILFKC